MGDDVGRHWRRAWPSWGGLATSGALVFLSVLSASGQAPVGSRSAGVDLSAPSADPSGVDAEVRNSGTPVPGSRITVGFDRAEEPGATYLWKQVEGPRVVLDDPTRPSIRLVVPAEADRLAFVVTVKTAAGERNIRVVVPIHREEAPAAPSGPIANAGDDQIGLVGRKITLNGTLSTPTDQNAGYRWIQIAGPKVTRTPSGGSYYSFTPRAPGIYRFVLVVASQRVISEPDEVEVVVGEDPSHAGPASQVSLVPPSLGPTVDRAIQLSGPIAGRTVGVSTAEVLGSIADRVDLYSDFGSLASEQMRRLDTIIPREPSARSSWQQVFGILSEQIVAEMIPLGLDLRQAQGYQQPLTPAQKERLKAMFRAYASEFQSRAQGR